MVRKKKSVLLSASIASVGLVAGALFVAMPKSQAADDETSASTIADSTIQEISEDTGFSENKVEEAFKTHTLIANIPDIETITKNSDIIDHKKIAKDVYILNYKDYDSTVSNYINLRDGDDANGVILNTEMSIIEDNGPIVTVGQGGSGISSALDTCANSTNATFPTATMIPTDCIGWGTKSMKLDTYANSLSSSTAVKVAVIDTGIHASHIAFMKTTAKDRLDMTLAHDYYDNDTDPDDSDNDTSNGVKVMHGTMVAGTISQSTPKNVKIVPIRVTGGRTIETAKIYAAISDLKGKVDVINLSLGSTVEVTKPFTGYYGTTAEVVLKEAKDAGSVIVAAAGNSGEGWVSYPAISDYTIGVSSVSEDGTFSSRFSQYGASIDFAAPGDTLVLPFGNDDAGFTLTSGTSFSTPYTSAAVANIITEHPNYTYDQIYNMLKLNAEDLGTAGKDNYYGWGSLSFHVNKFADLSIATPTVTAASDWTNGNVTIKANISSSAYNVNRYNFASGNTSGTTPSSWSTISSPAKTYSFSQTASANGTYTIWAKNSNNETAAKTVTVSNIDKTAPTISTAFATSGVTKNSATLSVGVTDATSGLGKIVWHYKADGAASYTDVTDTYATSGTGATTATSKTHALTGLQEGTKYTAYATAHDVAGNTKDSATATFTTLTTAQEIPATGVTITPTTATITVGGTTTLTATKAPSNSTDSITWSSSNTNVATVSTSGKVTAVSEGTATITARANASVSATATITVKAQPAAVPATSVTINPVSITMNAGEKKTITATLAPSNTTDIVTWISSDESVATVSSTGEVRAQKAGTATITARANASVAATTTITVQQSPKPVTTKKTVKNPKTADINVPAIAGIGTLLSAVAFLVFRAKRR